MGRKSALGLPQHFRMTFALPCRARRAIAHQPRAPVRQIVPDEWKKKLRHFMLDLDARIDSTLFSSGKGLRELYERYSTFMDRFYVGRWKRWVFIEPLSEVATIGLGGMILMLALAVPAFRETADDDWLKKSDLAVTFLDRYGNPIGSRGIKHNDSIPLEDFPDSLIKATLGERGPTSSRPSFPLPSAPEQ